MIHSSLPVMIVCMVALPTILFRPSILFLLFQYRYLQY